uniref:Arrestin_C domain-containing protein n=1 Tax=Haemonchus placei TaxID=6290 RepID=A0A0N4VW11_HAEPC
LLALRESLFISNKSKYPRRITRALMVSIKLDYSYQKPLTIPITIPYPVDDLEACELPDSFHQRTSTCLSPVWKCHSSLHHVVNSALHGRVCLSGTRIILKVKEPMLREFTPADPSWFQHGSGRS